MSALAEDSLNSPGLATWLLRIGGALVVVALIGVLAWWLRSLGADTPGPKRQVSRIALLPDTPPPPPPPPPKEEPRPKPRDEAKPLPVQAPKPQDTPPAQPEQIKMEGAAGDGPSAFGAGAVQNDYAGGVPATTAAPASTGTSSDRAQERFFASSARQLLRDEIEKHLKTESAQLTASFSVWFEGDGSIRRFELLPTGDPRADSELNAALTETSRSLKLAPPTGLTQPLRFRLTVRPLG